MSSTRFVQIFGFERNLYALSFNTHFFSILNKLSKPPPDLLENEERSVSRYTEYEEPETHVRNLIIVQPVSLVAPSCKSSFRSI